MVAGRCAEDPCPGRPRTRAGRVAAGAGTLRIIVGPGDYAKPPDRPAPAHAPRSWAEAIVGQVRRRAVLTPRWLTPSSESRGIVGAAQVPYRRPQGKQDG